MVVVVVVVVTTDSTTGQKRKEATTETTDTVSTLAFLQSSRAATTVPLFAGFINQRLLYVAAKPRPEPQV